MPVLSQMRVTFVRACLLPCLKMMGIAFIQFLHRMIYFLPVIGIPIIIIKRRNNSVINGLRSVKRRKNEMLTQYIQIVYIVFYIDH